LIRYHSELVQGDTEWLAARCGLLTASEMHLIITPLFKTASNDKSRAHLWELLAQRITRYVEPSYISDSMLRGMDDEIEAVVAYGKHHEKTMPMGFITNDRFGFTIGYSPDALVGDDGAVECKSRAAKYQVQTIVEGNVPAEYMIQLQTALLVSERKWIDFVSYSGGLPMLVIRVYPDAVVQAAIVEAAKNFEDTLGKHLATYQTASRDLIPTVRKIREEMI